MNGKDPDRPVKLHNLIKTFLIHSYIFQYPMIPLADSKGQDQPARMCRLIWAFAFRIRPKTRFRMAQLMYCPYNIDTKDFPLF